jgi:hypothetical protein
MAKIGTQLVPIYRNNNDYASLPTVRQISYDTFKNKQF